MKTESKEKPFTKEDFRVVLYDNQEVRWFIEKYLKTWPTNCQWCIGLIHKPSNTLIGVQCFGEPTKGDLFESISPLLRERDETMELQRGHILDGYGSEIETWFLGKCFKIIRNVLPHKKVIVSYSDPSVLNSTDPTVHQIGVIYQGLNGIFQEVNNKYVSVSLNWEDPEDPTKWRHSRAVQWTMGRHNEKEIERKLPPWVTEYWTKEESKKYRYVWVVDRQRDKELYNDIYNRKSPYPNKEGVESSKIIRHVRGQQGRVTPSIFDPTADRPRIFIPPGRPPGKNQFFDGNKSGKHHWLTPPDLYKRLDDEFHFDYDPCPYPLPEGYNGLTAEWGQSSYVNPPFGCIKVDGKKKGPTAWVKKAIEESNKGKDVVLLFPVWGYVLKAIDAGAEVRNLGQHIGWLAIEDGTPSKGTRAPIAAFIFRGKNNRDVKSMAV